MTVADRDPTYTPDPADVELVVAAMRDAPYPAVRDGYIDGREVVVAEARAVLAALAVTGRLLPADAEETFDYSMEYEQGLPVVKRRARRLTWPDGSTWVGPWLPAPTNTEESA